VNQDEVNKNLYRQPGQQAQAINNPLPKKKDSDTQGHPADSKKGDPDKKLKQDTKSRTDEENKPRGEEQDKVQ